MDFTERYFASVFDGTTNYMFHIFWVACLLTVAECILPQSRYTIVSRIRGAIFWIAYIPITVAGLTLFSMLWSKLGLQPAFHIDFSVLSSSNSPYLSAIGGVVAAWLMVQVGEFFYYWFHRAQHTSKFLWRFHAEHHSLEEMSALNSNHHITEELFRIPFITIPMSLLFNFEQGYVPWIWATLMSMQGLYEHSATKIHLSWFRYLVPDNRFHRIHHSKEKKHFNKNFGSGSAIWDIVFRTAHFPENGEWPDVGLSYMNEPQSVKEFLVRPFLKRKRKT